MKLIEHIEQIEPNSPVLKYKLTDEYFEIIKHDVTKSLELNTDVSWSLVGSIYEGREVQFITNYDKLQNIGYTYMDYFKNEDNSPFDFVLTESWVVEQKANDYNPLHMHSSFLSGIMYMQIPKCIGIEKDIRPRTQKHNVDGFIVFLNGYQYVQIKPEEGWGFIFPSNIPHQVYPFQGDETRISLSWNLDIQTKTDGPIRIGMNFNKEVK
jgi:uncharacterized protein (TIGR02466 family)